MADRVRSSAAKQEVLMRLMSNDPSLLGSLDGDLLASLTLAAPDPAAASDSDASPSSYSSADAAASSYASASASATKHTLIDPRLSFDVSASRNRPPTSKPAAVRLFSEEDIAPSFSTSSSSSQQQQRQIPKKRVLLHTESAPADAGSRVSENSAASTATTKNPVDTGRGRSNAMTRDTAPCPRKLVSLLDDKALAAYGDLKATSKPSPSPSPPPAKPHVPAQVQQSPLPPSVAPPSRGLAIKKKAKANNRRLAQAPAALAQLEPVTLLSAEQQYEFGGTIVGDAGCRSSSMFDTVDRSTIESTRSSSHDSNESDDSCSSMSFATIADAPPPSSSTASAGSRQKASQVVMDHRCFVTRDQWVAKSARRSCAVCERDFGVLRKRHSCRMCGDVICSRCSVFRAVNLSVVEGKCRICSCCSVSYRKKLEDIVSFTAAVTDAEASSASRSEDAEEPPDLLSSRSSSSSAKGAERILLTERTLMLLKADDAKSRYDSELSTLLASDDAVSSPSLSFSVSDLSFSSSSSSSRNVEEELEAALRARQLEKEVEASRGRIAELEVKIAEQESHKERLSSEQQSQLDDARRLISVLQEKLQQQEVSARAAAATRDSICLSNLRQAESYSSGDDESRALKKKLQVLERQLQQAGINVAEVIPYEVARAKVAEIARRLQEIGSSELVLDDKQAQAAARREYYQLEQDMEKYNTALVMTDEYVEEQRRNETQFEDENRDANARALQLLRSAIPVDISRLSEAQLRSLATPSGVAFPPDLAKRLKRTNVLQLLRADPKDIARMHPSVVEGYRTTGLTLLERRALHEVMLAPFRAWKRQQMDEMSQRKFQWYKKLRDALESAVRTHAQHCASDDPPSVHACKLLGLACPVRAEAKVAALYSAGLGFPETAEYFTQEVTKSDPEGAGEKALQEAQSYAREMVANQRQRELKAHYKLNLRQIAQAMGALEEIDAIVEKLKTLDAAVVELPSGVDDRGENCDDIDSQQEMRSLLQQQRQQLALDCEAILQTGRELVLLLARRAGICVVGKRNPANDEPDSRSPLERQCAASAAAFLGLLLEDVRAFFTEGEKSASGSALGSLRYISELLEDVTEKNLQAGTAAEAADGSSQEADVRESAAECKRVPWRERSIARDVPESVLNADGSSELLESKTVSLDSSASAADRQAPVPEPSVVLPTSASLFDAIRARKQRKSLPPTTVTSKEVSPVSAEEVASVAAKPPVDLFAAIRARNAKLTPTDPSEEDAPATAAEIAATRSA